MENNNTTKYKNLIELLCKALGDRSWNQYALNAEVDSGHLSRIKNGNFNKPPKPEFLLKLARKAHNGVTYEDLMMAAGYLVKDNIESDEIKIKSSDEIKNEQLEHEFRNC